MTFARVPSGTMLHSTIMRPVALANRSLSELAVTIDETAAVPSDALLQASRRIDWRFLLPDPNLGRVAYLGQPLDALCSALTLFADEVCVFAPATVTGDWPAAGNHYDVVVARNPTQAGLTQAVTLLKPGGSLYIELHSPWRFFRAWLRSGFRTAWGRPRLGRATDYRTAIQALGLKESESYWFWPNFDACTKIMPLGERAALLHALTPQRHFASRLGRWPTQSKRWLVDKLAASALLELVAPTVGIVAR